MHKLAKCKRTDCYVCLFWVIKRIAEYAIAERYMADINA